MVTGTHPDDIVLFEYVEGELAGPLRLELEAHLASCAHCSEQVARMGAGREALREARPLELPEPRREAILANLPVQRSPRGRPDFSLKRLVAVLTPVAAVAAVVFVLVSTDAIDSGGDEGAGGGEAAGVAVSEDSATSATGGTAPATGGGADAENRMKSTLLFADGPADAVAADLRAKGLDAEVVANHVEVRNTTRAEVRRALRGRRDGSVRVIIVR